MRYALIFEHKTLGQRGVVDFHDTEDLAIQSANTNAAARPEFSFFVAPMQTQICGDVMVSTTVMAPTVTTTAVAGTVAPAPLTTTVAPLTVSPSV